MRILSWFFIVNRFATATAAVKSARSGPAGPAGATHDRRGVPLAAGGRPAGRVVWGNRRV